MHRSLPLHLPMTISSIVTVSEERAVVDIDYCTILSNICWLLGSRWDVGRRYFCQWPSFVGGSYLRQTVPDPLKTAGRTSPHQLIRVDEVHLELGALLTALHVLHQRFPWGQQCAGRLAVVVTQQQLALVGQRAHHCDLVQF